MSVQAESYDGSAPTSYFITSLNNGSLNGLSSQLAKESHLSDEVCIFSDSIILDGFSTMCAMSTFSQLLWSIILAVP